MCVCVYACSEACRNAFIFRFHLTSMSHTEGGEGGSADFLSPSFTRPYRVFTKHDFRILLLYFSYPQVALTQESVNCGFQTVARDS